MRKESESGEERGLVFSGATIAALGLINFAALYAEVAGHGSGTSFLADILLISVLFLDIAAVSSGTIMLVDNWRSK